MNGQRGIVDGRYPIQAERGKPYGTIDEAEAREVFEAYAARYGRSQSFERIAERAVH